VDVWIADWNSADNRNFKEVMSDAELDRAARFYFERHRVRFIFSHGVLRGVLSNYLRCLAKDIEFEGNEFGKPSLKATSSNNDLMFNMSHSGDLVIVAVATRRLVGVDIEFMRPLRDMTAVAERNFTPNERVVLEKASLGEKEHVFYTCWTRKEAFIKAVGRGLSIPLTSFDITTAPGISTRTLPRTIDAPQVERWWLSDLTTPNGYAGALVVEGDASFINHRQWRP
jgi:4'-phosphopantetheinyl transferase